MLKASQNRCDLRGRWSEWYEWMVRISGGREFSFIQKLQLYPVGRLYLPLFYAVLCGSKF